MTDFLNLGLPVVRKMKEVVRVRTILEAQSIKMQLGSCGIEAFIPDEESGVLPQRFFTSQNGIGVQVADEDEEAAREVMEGFRES